MEILNITRDELNILIDQEKKKEAIAMINFLKRFAVWTNEEGEFYTNEQLYDLFKEQNK